jgi:hypothetical protein
MDKIQQAEFILKDAEKALIDVATAAATERDYDAASLLLDVAREVNRLPHRLRPVSREFGYTKGGLGGSSKRRPIQDGSIKTGVMKHATYPQFVRDGNALVKIAWSKAEKSEYEHKTPKHVLSALTSRLERIGGNGKRFTMESVMPLVSEDGADIPSYQLYLCLAWLRQIGVVLQHGRQGYSLKSDEGLPSAVESRWKELPER